MVYSSLAWQQLLMYGFSSAFPLLRLLLFGCIAVYLSDIFSLSEAVWFFSSMSQSKSSICNRFSQILVSIRLEIIEAVVPYRVQHIKRAFYASWIYMNGSPLNALERLEYA